MAAPTEKMNMSKVSKKGKKRGKIGKKKRNLKLSKNKNPSKASFSSEADSAVTGIEAKGQWKTIEFDYNLFNANELNEFCGLEELTNYELVRGMLPTDDAIEDREIVTGNNSLTKKGKKRKQGDNDDATLPEKKKKKKSKLKKGESDKQPESGNIVEGGDTVSSVYEEQDGKEDIAENKRTSKEKQKKKGKKKKGQKLSKLDSGDGEGKTDSGKHLGKASKTKKSGKAKGKSTARTQKNEQSQGKSTGKKSTYTRPLPQENTDLDMSAWESLSVPSLVLKALQDLSFTKPTPIQSECIPAAIKERRDILGAAETGSGKTLAFGIPVIHHILRLRNQQKYHPTKTKDEEDEDKREEKEEEDDEEEEPDEFEAEESDLEWEESDSEHNDDIENKIEGDEKEVGTEVEEMQEQEEGKENSTVEQESGHKPGAIPSQKTGIMALVMTPTRELAVQVKNHLVAIAKYTGIKVAVLCGGISAEKQERLLKKNPEIVVGTPGRLWELYTARSSPHLLTLGHVRYLVIDEADRMVERGHYIELGNIMDLLNGSHMHKKRQTLIFSATLTMVNLGPLKPNPASDPNKYKDKTQLDTVLSKVAVHEDAKIVDLTSKQGTVATLMEAKIVCNFTEKDIYLYYFLLQYPGRTLVFTNSIEAIRRLLSILTLLQCNPLPLHSSMHQRQRLKNLDRFASNPHGLLLATDVAARGLDIPNVQHVIHYHVPKTSDSYVHRSGRTARASKTGLSVMIVSAQEVKSFRRVCKALSRDDLPNFPTELRFFEAVEERVDLAREVDKLELSMTKKKKQNQWYENAAKEMDVDLDDILLNDIGSDVEQKEHTGKMRQLKGALKSLLRQKLFPRWSSQLYPTLDGALVQTFSSSDSAAAMSNLKVQVTVDKEEAEAKQERKKRKFKKFKKTRKFQVQAAKNKAAAAAAAGSK